MDTTTKVVLIVLLIAFGIFIGIQLSSGSSAEGVSQIYSSYPSQIGGGGCGR